MMYNNPHPQMSLQQMQQAQLLQQRQQQMNNMQNNMQGGMSPAQMQAMMQMMQNGGQQFNGQQMMQPNQQQMMQMMMQVMQMMQGQQSQGMNQPAQNGQTRFGQINQQPQQPAQRFQSQQPVQQPVAGNSKANYRDAPAQPQPVVTNNYRNHQPQVQTMQPIEEEKGWNVLVVDNVALKYPRTNEGIEMKAKVTPYNPRSYHRHDGEENFIISDGLEDAILEVNTIFRESESTSSTIVFGVNVPLHREIDGAGAVDREAIVKLFNTDAECMYRAMREVAPVATAKETMVVLNYVDEYMTGKINVYLKLNIDQDWKMDSFAVDFNELLNLVQREYPEEFEALTNFTNKLVLDLKTNYDNLAATEENAALTYNEIVVRHRLHHFEVGLKDVGTDHVLVDREAETNIYLISLAQQVKKSSGFETFLLLSSDQMLYRFTLNNDGELFVHRVK